jgi:hypothetical protein
MQQPAKTFLRCCPAGGRSHPHRVNESAGRKNQIPAIIARSLRLALCLVVVAATVSITRAATFHVDVNLPRQAHHQPHHRHPITRGATFYVDLNSTNPKPPFLHWSTAATNIQDAIDVAGAGDQVLVNDGIYSTGGMLVNNPSQTNRVVVNKPLTVRSVHGPAATVIEGDGYQGGVRCVYLAAGATLIGFTLTNGSAFYDEDGGGVWCESNSATVSNCVISGNWASSGAGAYGGTLNNCTLTGNNFGGGAEYCSLNI